MSEELSQQSGWYAARILFERLVDGVEDVPPLFEEQVILVRAGSCEEARERAEDLGRTTSHAYQNAFGEMVSWEFREVWHTVALFTNSFQEGEEVYSNFLDRSQVEHLRRGFGQRDV